MTNKPKSEKQWLLCDTCIMAPVCMYKENFIQYNNLINSAIREITYNPEYSLFSLVKKCKFYSDVGIGFIESK